MSTLHDSIDFVGRASLPPAWEEDVFRYCTLSDLNVDGEGFSGMLMACVLQKSDWYWGLFNMAAFVRVEFRECTFRGCTFASCLFTECRFVGCQFIRDNLGGDCSFPDSSWHGNEQADCVGLPHELVPATSLPT